MFKHLETCGFVPLRNGACPACSFGMQVQIRTRADGGELRVDSYCPVCILRNDETVKRERDDAIIAQNEYRNTVKQMLDKLPRITQERNEARAERDDWKNAASAWERTAKSWQDDAEKLKRERDDAVTACEANIAQSVKFRHEASEVRRERDEYKTHYEVADAALTRSLNACEALKRDNASLTERLAIVTQERDTAKADKDAHIRGGMFNAWANGNCDRHGRYQIAIEKGGAPAICCPECARADLERERDEATTLYERYKKTLTNTMMERDSLKSVSLIWERKFKELDAERDALQSRANCAEEELKQVQREREAYKYCAEQGATKLHARVADLERERDHARNGEINMRAACDTLRAERDQARAAFSKSDALRADLERERDSLMGANAIWEENRKRWNRERDALQSRVKELQQTLATAQIECNDARRQIDVMKGKASPVNHPSASVVPVQTDAQTEQYAEGFAAGRADGRRATYGDGFKEGRASAFEQISDYIRNAWRKG